MFETIFSVTFLLQSLRISTPYALPALGATVSEKSGVVNIGLEGILLISAFATTVGTFYTDMPLFGIFCGIIAGIMTAMLHSLVCVTFKADQIVSGIAINLLAIGLTKFASQLIFNSSSNSARIPGLESIRVLESTPVLHHSFFIATILLVAFITFLLFKTRFGLRVRAVGEHPQAADTLGVDVAWTRHAAGLICGALTGLGGAWLAIDQHSFTDGMSAGRGFIALAAMIIGKWHPLGAAGAALLFGFAESLTIQLQNTSQAVQFIQMIPYVLTMVVLAGFIGRATPPAADGIPYEKEAR